jgi:hypothetical protein
MKILSLRDRIRLIDWRIFLGAVMTVSWIAGAAVYLSAQPDRLLDMHIDELGGFLEGAFAPLAFLWLVIGLFIQQKELADNTEVMRQSMLQAQQQAEAMAALEVNARQEAFFKIADNVKKELGVIAGMQFISAFGSTEGNIVAESRIRELLQAVSTGDDEAFVREFLSVNVPLHDQRQRVFYGTDIRRRHSMTFRDTFERLLALAEKCDTDKLISGTVTHTAMGLYYNMLVRLAPGESGVLVDVANVLEQAVPENGRKTVP